MFTKILIKLIKKNKNMKALLEDEDIREAIINNLNNKEKAKVLESIDYSNIVTNANLVNKKINLSNSILVNVKINSCNIKGGIKDNLIYQSTISANTILPVKKNTEKIELISID